VGTRRCFASALDFPGWARSARGEAAALDALESYRGRYSAVLERCGLRVPTGRLVVDVTTPGDATTEFGAPSAIVDADRRRLTSADRTRLASVLDAAWLAFDEATAREVNLATGPRGGGRSFTKLIGHVTDAEVAYARGLGLRVSATNGDSEKIAALRGEIRALVVGERDPDRDAKWPLRYGVRRIAWHVLDHLFELEDRTTSH
jgi:hypothetical protein